MFRKLLTLFTFFSFLAIQTAGAEFLYLGRSQEGLLMGDAYTAVADDENTLFYNPAALGRHRGVSITPINPRFQGPGIVDVDFNPDNFGAHIDNRFKNFPESPAAIADRILGIPLYLQLSANPTIKMQHFGMSLFINSKTNMVLENAINPEIDLSYRLDRGFIAGYAFTFGQGANKKGNGFQSALGFSVKSLNRQGLEGNFPLMGPQLLQIIDNSDSFSQIRKNLGYGKGSAWGVDTGLELNYLMGVSRITLGASILDIGDTSFSTEEGIRPPPQKMSANFGASWNQDFTIFDYTLSCDYSNAIDPLTPPVSKLKLGARARFPIIDFYMGYNGGYGSWGVGIEILFMKITAGFYGVEIGHEFREKEAKRFVLALNLLTIELGGSIF